MTASAPAAAACTVCSTGLRFAIQASCNSAKGFYFGEAILRARAQYRVAAADGQEPEAVSDWQQTDFTAAELHEHSDSAAGLVSRAAGP